MVKSFGLISAHGSGRAPTTQRAMKGLVVVLTLLLTGGLLVMSSPTAGASPVLYLPYAAGTSHTVTQGNMGAYSHNGTYGSYAIDFSMADNTSVRASAAGTIVSARGGCPNSRLDSCNAGLGNFLVVQHSSGFCTQYAHLRSFTRTSGTVAQGQEIGRSGNSGWSTGPHLDFRRTRCDSVSQPFAFAEYSGSYHDSSIRGKVLTSKNTAAPAVFDPCSYRGWVVGATGTTAKYLVQQNCKRAHIPTGGDYSSIVANVGASRVKTFSTVTSMNRIPSSGLTVRTGRIDQPLISGPTQYIRYVSGVGSAAFNGNYHWTTHAAGRPLTNEGRWDIALSAPGVYRIKCFIPNRTDAWASVVYRVHDGSTLRFTKGVRQADHIGWVHLGDTTVVSNVAKIRLRDNEGAGPYNARFAYDACEAVPIR